MVSAYDEGRAYQPYKNTMVNLTITPNIKTALDALERLHLDLENACQYSSSGHSLVNPVVGNPISHDQIIAISKLLRDHHEYTSITSVPYHLDDLLRGSRVFLEPPKPTAEPVSSMLSSPPIPLVVVMWSRRRVIKP